MIIRSLAIEHEGVISMKKECDLFVVLVDAHNNATRQNEKRGAGRYYVRAKNEKDAEKLVIDHIGKLHGSVRCYYKVTDQNEINKYKDLVKRGDIKWDICI